MTPLDPCSHLGPHFCVSLTGIIDFLNCNLIVNYRELRGQCSVNGNPLLHLGDGKQEGNATELCPHLSQSLKDTLGVMWSLQSGKYEKECKGRHDK